MNIITRITFPSGDYTDVVLNSEKKFTKNFTIGEMANKMAKDTVKLIITDDVRTFAAMLQDFRKWYTLPMTVNSWYRTKAFNASCGGDPRSAHMMGTAVDWGIKGHTDIQRKNVQTKWAQLCDKYGVVGAVNFYTNGYHLEAFSDKAYGNKNFAIRDYRGKKGDW